MARTESQILQALAMAEDRRWSMVSPEGKAAAHARVLELREELKQVRAEAAAERDAQAEIYGAYATITAGVEATQK